MPQKQFVKSQKNPISFQKGRGKRLDLYLNFIDILLDHKTMNFFVPVQLNSSSRERDDGYI